LTNSYKPVHWITLRNELRNDMNVITSSIVKSAWGIFISTMRQYPDSKATMADTMRELTDTARVLAGLLNVDGMELQFRLETMLHDTINICKL